MEFDTLSNYTNIAKKTISKFASKFYPGLAKEMLSNEETVSEIASAIMFADWNWDQNRKGKITGKGKSMYSYRNQCAIWAIKTYITNKYKKSKKHQKQTEHFVNNYKESYGLNPADIYEEKEYFENLSTDVKDLLTNAPLTNKQRQQLSMYYFEDKTLSEIGKEFGVTREAIRQNINKAIAILQKSVGV